MSAPDFRPDTTLTAISRRLLASSFFRRPPTLPSARAAASDGATVKRLFRWRAPLHLPLGFAVRKEDGAGTNRLWPIVPEFPEFAYAVALRARPGFRFTWTAGGAATTLLLAFALALRLATLVGSTVATSIVSTVADLAATISIPLTLADSGAVTSIVPVTASIAAALAAECFSRRHPNPTFFANADRCAA
jgi:hypothetical protein